MKHYFVHAESPVSFVRARLRSAAVAVWVGLLLEIVSSRLIAQAVTTAGTTYTDAEGRSWAYLTWTADDPAILDRSPLVIYRKVGAVDAPGEFERLALVERSEDPAVVSAALQRSTRIGADLAVLEEGVDGLFGGLLPSPSLSLAEKFRVLLRVAREQADVGRSLQFFTRRHAGAALALGRAYLVELPRGTTHTFELRQGQGATSGRSETLAPIGRVTLSSGIVPVLPAPGAPRDVSWENGQGDLNVRLVWATPQDLLEESMLQAGYNLYRVNSTYYSREFASRTPNPGELAAAGERSPADVQRVNPQPIFPERTYLPAEVPALDPATVVASYIDDHRRFDTGGVPFADGDRYYYFVAARDLLGREGRASAGTLVTICGRRAPLVPRDPQLDVVTRFNPSAGSNEQHFRVRWLRGPTNATEVPTDAYRIYRWRQVRDVALFGNDPAAHPSIAEVPSPASPPAYLEFEDRTATRPTLPADDQRTFWYTVRAVRRTPCGSEILSPHSRPVFGALRTWDGPGEADGNVETYCVRPTIRFLEQGSATTSPSPAGTQRLVLEGRRTSPAVAWMDFWLAGGTGGGLEYLGRTYFANGRDGTVLEVLVRASGSQRVVRCQAGLRNGGLSEVVAGDVLPGGGSGVRAVFEARLAPGGYVAAGSCGHHASRDPVTGELRPVQVTLRYPARVREHRLYYRIDDGEPVLFDRGIGEPGSVHAVPFRLLPANAAQLCIYAKMVDSQGLEGPMTLLRCFAVEGVQEMPVPMLATPESASLVDGAMVAVLQWFCPPQAVERFQVFVRAPGNESPMPEQISADLYPALQGEIGLGEQLWRVYESGRVGANFGALNSPEFTARIRVTPGVPYEFRVRAVNAAGGSGAASEPVSFIWSGVVRRADGLLAWPARGLPEVHSGPSGTTAARGGARPATTYPPPPPLLRAETWELPSGAVRNGVLIAQREIPGEETVSIDPQVGRVVLRGEWNFADLERLPDIQTTLQAQPVLPCALYRYQVSNAEYPRVTGDLYQVSPLMQRVAHRVRGTPGDESTEIVDPFIGVRVDKSGVPALARFYLLDTHPVLSGASYRYLVVHFQSNGEIASVTQTGAITVPSNP